MQAIAETGVLLGLFNLGGRELILCLALVVIVVRARKLPELSRGLGRGIFEFRDSARRVTEEIDEEASEAGRAVGGIYGKAAAQAIAPDNQVAELYDPAVFRKITQPRKRPNFVIRRLLSLREMTRRVLRAIRGVGR